MPTADYMRAYRARKKAEAAGLPTSARPRRAEPSLLTVAEARIAELETEVRHLKQDLASRPTIKMSATRLRAVEDIEDRPRIDAIHRQMIEHPFGAPKPAPKPSRSSTSARGRAD